MPSSFICVFSSAKEAIPSIVLAPKFISLLPVFKSEDGIAEATPSMAVEVLCGLGF